MLLSAERFWPRFAFVLMAMSSFVQAEPAPYDFVLILGAVLFLIGKPKLPTGLLWPGVCILIIVAGYAIGAMFAISYADALNYIRTSAFLSTSLLIIAALIWRDPERIVPMAMAGLVASSLIASIIGILAYFDVLPNSQDFALYGRATGTFKDPNVFGPSLVLPALYIAQRLTTRSLKELWWSLPVFFTLLLALFLSFSRGAWLNFVMSAIFFFSVSYATAAPAYRKRLVGFGVFLVVAGSFAVLVALSIEDVRDLFLQRFVIVQDYDSGEGGRFDNMMAAFMTALKNPFGIGPYQWPLIAGLMPHNTYVNVFVSGGLIALSGYAGLMLLTLWTGFRAVKFRPPHYDVFVVALAVFFAHVVQNFTIDTNHWRHLYIACGLVWGLALAAESRIKYEEAGRFARA
jgi:hypothetical protein